MCVCAQLSQKVQQDSKQTKTCLEEAVSPRIHNIARFFQQKAKKERQDLRLAAMVTAVTSLLSLVKMRPHIQQEEEEPEDDKIMAEEGPKIISTIHIHKHMLETSAASNMAQPCGLEGATASCVVETATKPI